MFSICNCITFYLPLPHRPILFLKIKKTKHFFFSSETVSRQSFNKFHFTTLSSSNPKGRTSGAWMLSRRASKKTGKSSVVDHCFYFVWLWLLKHGFLRSTDNWAKTASTRLDLITRYILRKLCHNMPCRIHFKEKPALEIKACRQHLFWNLEIIGRRNPKRRLKKNMFSFMTLQAVV